VFVELLKDLGVAPEHWMWRLESFQGMLAKMQKSPKSPEVEHASDDLLVWRRKEFFAIT
jgi:hypothetical protein